MSKQLTELVCMTDDAFALFQLICEQKGASALNHYKNMVKLLEMGDETDIGFIHIGRTEGFKPITQINFQSHEQPKSSKKMLNGKMPSNTPLSLGIKPSNHYQSSWNSLTGLYGVNSSLPRRVITDHLSKTQFAKKKDPKGSASAHISQLVREGHLKVAHLNNPKLQN